MLAMDIKLDGDGIWSDLEDGKRPIHRVDDGVLRICTLEGGMQGGMQGGNPSVVIRLDLADGSTVLAQTSVRLWQQAAAAMRGRYGDV